MAKGAQAKQLVINKIQEVFGENFIGEVDKKIYVWSQENGERVQVALALTCPKVPVAAAEPTSAISDGGDWNFEDSPITFAAGSTKKEITEDERQRVADLMEKLGL